MAKELRLRRGTTAQHSTFTGANGEVTVDTTKKTVVVHDGATAGGVPLATEAAVNAKQNADAELTTLAGMSADRATFLAGTQGFGFRNRIINGDMRIDQRNNGGSVSIGTAAPFIVDRWNAYTDLLNMTGQRSTIVPSGFTNSLGITVGTGASPSAGQISRLEQRIEGFNVADLGWGTASAQTITLSFWVRSSVTGTHSGALGNQAGNRSYPFTFTISAANTWEYKTVTIAGDTTGTWLTDNGTGVRVLFNLGTGSTFLGTAGSWAGSNFFGATGSVQLSATTGATFQITGVQLEAGSVATPFERRDYGRELALCQRYCEFQNFSYVTINYKGGGVYFKVPKRATPTMVFYSRVNRGGTVGSVQETNASGSDFAVTFSEPTPDGLISVGTGVTVNATMAGSFIASAEL